MHGVTKQIAEILDKLEAEEARAVLEELGAHVAQRVREEPLRAADVTPEAVWDLFKKKCETAERNRDGEGFDPRTCADVDRIAEGLDAVEFTLENGECEAGSPGSECWGSLIGPRRFGKLAGVGCYGGGDWEYPIFFVVYVDADGATLRSYIPRDGNVWNYDVKAAFGNYDSDAAFLANWLRHNKPDVPFHEDELVPAGHGGVMFDEAKIIADIGKRISVVKA